jgi:hypothetical protein
VNCTSCDKDIDASAQICPRCNALVFTQPTLQSLELKPSKPSSRKPATILVFICGILLAFASIASFDGPAVIVAIVCIGIFCFGWSKPGMGATAKISFCIASILLVFSLSFLQKRNAERTRVDAVQARDRQAKELKDKNDAAFAQLTPLQHFDRAQGNLKVGADAATLALANQDLDDLANTNFAPRAKAVRLVYAKSLATEEHNAAVAAVKAAKDKAVVDAVVDRVLRDQMAKTVENTMLDEGYNVDVTADGPNHTTLRFKWIFVDKVFVHNFSKQTDVFDAARKEGFKKIVATDGYDENWSWTLQ